TDLICVYLNVVNLVIPIGFDPWVSIHVLKLEIWAGKIISPYHLYLNPKLVVKQYQFWRLITNFLYFRKMASVLTGIVLIGGMIPYLSASFARIIFLSNSLTFMMVYVWSKQNPFIHMSFLGLFTFTAAYLPWVLLGFSVLVGASAWVDLL
ncbi:hypothetical protein Gohar_003109, partial [Gossypium harknessii]|nr:hypothetical protein [Gossypium harknessii]